MNKDKLTNDTTSGKTQLDPISGSDGFDGSHNPPPKGDSCSPSTPGSDNPFPKGKANSDSAPIGSDNPSPKGDSSPPSPRPPITGKPSKSEIESNFPTSNSEGSIQSSNNGSNNGGGKGVGKSSRSSASPGGGNNPGGKGK
ncbi:hypothetical protein [Nostoc sphaeroides]|uniref:Uncharacterized protein n=1 Tax=Nostoc sphaeroides CCNUC1 TaxID=2653204 RepID=A0A5P8VRY5_9NOSO|nr:hypothetical protein [Nostoc sphaeroides]QFS42669.1 hypothetical protein GXM_00142 [Nostoc sphaeroides CCNUC1]